MRLWREGGAVGGVDGMCVGLSVEVEGGGNGRWSGWDVCGTLEGGGVVGGVDGTCVGRREW